MLFFEASLATLRSISPIFSFCALKVWAKPAINGQLWAGARFLAAVGCGWRPGVRPMSALFFGVDVRADSWVQVGYYALACTLLQEGLCLSKARVNANCSIK